MKSGYSLVFYCVSCISYHHENKIASSFVCNMFSTLVQIEKQQPVVNSKFREKKRTIYHKVIANDVIYFCND